MKDPSSAVQNIVPPGAYPDSENTRYDGHYVLDYDLPTMATLPQRFETSEYYLILKSSTGDFS